jgi:hypothetical protein
MIPNGLGQQPEPVTIRDRIRQAVLRTGATPSEAQFGSYVYDFVVKIARQKRERDCKAALHQDYYNGDQWKVLDQRHLFIRNNPNIKMVVNNYGVVVNHQASAIMAMDMKSEALAASDSPEDRASADVVNAMIEDHYYRNDRATNERIATLAVLNGGDHFFRLRFDESQLGTIVVTPEEMNAFQRILSENGHANTSPIQATKMSDGRIRAVYAIGGTCEHHVPADHVFPENGPTRWEDVTRVAVVDYPSVRNARLMWPRKADKIRSETIQNTRGLGEAGQDWQDGDQYRWRENNSQIGTNFTEDAEMCRVVTYYEKSDDGTWDMAVLTGQSLQFTLHVERGLPMLPIVKYSYEPAGLHRLWSNSLGNKIRPLAYTHNAILNQYFDYLREALKDTLVMPDGPGKHAPITNRFRQVFKYPAMARTAPQFLSQNPRTLQIYLEAASVVLNQMWEVGSLGAATRGMAGDRMSGAAITQQTQNNQTPLQFIRQMIGDSTVAKDRVALSMAQQFYSIPRLVSIAGEYSEAGVKIVSSSDITAGTTIRLVKTDVTPENQAARRDLFIQLFQAGLGNPEFEEQRRAMLYYIQTGKNYATRPPEERQAESQQTDEIRLIMEDRTNMAPEIYGPDGQMQKPPRLIVSETGESLFRPYQIHQIHIRVLMDKLNGQGLSEYHRGLLEVHLQEHQGYLEQEQQIAQAQAIQMEAEQSKARMTGQMATTLVAQQAKDAASAEKPGFAPEQGGELAESAG